MGDLEFHRLADLFPLIEGAEFDELVADVSQHGVREPIVTYGGKILDGRNRYRAAQAAGVECPARDYDGEDPLAFVVSLNLKRRHLYTSQRAMVAARLATLKNGQRADEVAGTSIEAAASLLNVGRASVERARIVQNEGTPGLVAAVDAGEISVSGAVEQIRRGIVTGNAMRPFAERGVDLYQTPPEAVRALLDVEPLPPKVTIWECASGPGSIVRVLREAGHRVVATDLVDYGLDGALGGVDFLAQESAPHGAEVVLTNPPFMHAAAFVRHALRLVPRVIFLLRLAFVESVGRSDILDGGQLARIYPFSNRLPMMHRGDYDGTEATSAICFAWYCWDREHRGPTTLQRISWSAEQRGASS